MLTDTLKKALRDEAQALNEFAAGQKSLQVLIGRRQWTRLQSQIDELKTLASRVEALEDFERREGFYLVWLRHRKRDYANHGRFPPGAGG